jgi:hypothetical protein
MSPPPDCRRSWRLFFCHILLWCGILTPLRGFFFYKWGGLPKTVCLAVHLSNSFIQSVCMLFSKYCKAILAASVCTVVGDGCRIHLFKQVSQCACACVCMWTYRRVRWLQDTSLSAGPPVCVCGPQARRAETVFEWTACHSSSEIRPERKQSAAN